LVYQEKIHDIDRFMRQIRGAHEIEEAGMVLEIPVEALEICRVLAEAGERAWVVGGAVRDLIAGRRGGDVDLATSAPPRKVMELFERVVPTGLKHGTVTVLLGPHHFEVTTLRGEGTYSDGRHPDVIEFIDDINKDLARRDFTINAMAWDPIDEELFDPFGGQRDLSARILRAVGDPAERFTEDGLRLLRAARFSATLDFDIEEETFRAMPAATPSLTGVSMERKRDELARVLGAQKPSRGLEVMRRAQLLPAVSGELDELARRGAGEVLGGASWERTLARVDRLPDRLPLRLAGLLEDVDFGEGTASRWMSEMRFEKRLGEAVGNLVEDPGPPVGDEPSDLELRRYVARIGREAVEDHLLVVGADLVTADTDDKERGRFDSLSARVREVAASEVPLTVRELPVGGADLIERLGIPAGPGIGHLLEALLERAMDRPDDASKEELLRLAGQLAAKME